MLENLQTSVHISGVWSTSLWYSDLQDEASTLSSLLLSSIKKSLKMIFLQRMLSEERSSHRRQLCPALAISWRECHESQSLITCPLTFASSKKNILRRSSSGRNSQVSFVVMMISQRSVLRSYDQSPSRSNIKIKVSHSFLYVFQSSSFASFS